MRDSVLFYRSFYDALKNIPPEERLRVYDSIMEYGMYDREPELDGVALAIFLLAKPQIDANNKRYENGCKAKKKRTRSETEANSKQDESVHEAKEKEKVKEKDNVKDKDNKYSRAFEVLWSAYPRKKEKANAYRCYKARLSDGFSEDELLTAVKRYADECLRNRTEQKYIKHGSTFLSESTPFLDYLGDDYKPDVPRLNVRDNNNFERRQYDMDKLELDLLEVN